MMKSMGVAGVLCVGAWALCACNPSKPEQATSTGSPAPAPKPLKLPVAKAAICKLNPLQPGPLRRGGIAHVRLSGDGVELNLRDVPALCGPLFNTDVTALGVHAGDGVLFETCIPEGIVQISSWTRTPGKQSVHGNADAGGTEVLFNRNEGATYTTRGEASDSLVLSDDLWKAEATLALYSVASNNALRAQITFDCPPAGPWEDVPKPDAPEPDAPK